MSRDDHEFDRVLDLARQADTLRLARIEATLVQPHRAQPDVPRRWVAVAAVVGLVLISGPALLLAATPSAATTPSPTPVVTTPSACCSVRRPTIREPLIVEELPAVVSAPPRSPSASATPTASRTPALQLVIVPSLSAKPSSSPSGSPSPSPSPHWSTSPSPSAQVSHSAGPGCALPPS